jgi:hypothetical protein
MIFFSLVIQRESASVRVLRECIRWLETCFRTGNRFIRVQRQNSKRTPSHPIILTYPKRKDKANSWAPKPSLLKYWGYWLTFWFFLRTLFQILECCWPAVTWIQTSRETFTKLARIRPLYCFCLATQLKTRMNKLEWFVIRLVSYTFQELCWPEIKHLYFRCWT